MINPLTIRHVFPCLLLYFLPMLANAGVGYRMPLSAREDLLIQLSWKHFSNADLFSDNDGIDVPFVLSLGLAF